MAEPNRAGMLDEPPPQPPGGAKKARRTLMDTQGVGMGGANQPPMGLGAEASNPLVIATQAMGGIQENIELLSAVLPQLAPALMGFITQLQQVVPQAMADSVAGIQGAGAGMPPGGAAPGAMPPGPPPGGPPAGVMGP